MDILKMGAELLSQKLGLSVDADTVQGALGGLLGDGEGGIDLKAIVSNMMASGGLASAVTSWLGDGDNSPIDAGAVTSLFGESKLSDFAGKLGVDTESAAGGLADVLPQMIDKSSSGGGLLDSVLGGKSSGDLLNAAKSFFS
ncbi:MAG: hypothetical protein CSA53_05170 [Gammaproteobacteria bacterium]|nr:MAG: hypothetical protein CSA53_05170 [Gammaproteobacteria bacterium]